MAAMKISELAAQMREMTPEQAREIMAASDADMLQEAPNPRKVRMAWEAMRLPNPRELQERQPADPNADPKVVAWVDTETADIVIYNEKFARETDRVMKTSGDGSAYARSLMNGVMAHHANIAAILKDGVPFRGKILEQMMNEASSAIRDALKEAYGLMPLGVVKEVADMRYGAELIRIFFQSAMNGTFMEETLPNELFHGIAAKCSALRRELYLWELPRFLTDHLAKIRAVEVVGGWNRSEADAPETAKFKEEMKQAREWAKQYASSPLPELTQEQKASARELMHDQIRHDAEVRYGPRLRQQDNAGAEGEGSGADDPVLATRREIRAALELVMAAWREKTPGLPMRSASEEEARGNPYSPGWYDPVSGEVIVNDVVAEKVALMIAHKAGTDGAGRWAAAFMSEERAHALSDRVERWHG